AARKGIVIQNNIAAATMVNADKDMFALIIRNLLGNAIKYSFKNGVVELNAMEENGQITFSVKDNGGGIADKKLLHINAPTALSIESSMGTDNEKGTGLGLMLCKTFASLMNGKIVAKSEPKKGSEFLLTLPNAD
ncbi:MAG: ATP-binding protein, partial [Bacteroidia bacterium]